MSYEIVDARYANIDKSCVVIYTADFGDVAISEKDTPALWKKLQEWINERKTIKNYSFPNAKEEEEIETLIQKKLRDNAIADLKKEGKLDANGKLKK